MSSHSTELWARAQIVIPGGVNSPVRSFRGVGGTTPVFFKRGSGPYLIDADDRQFIDYVCSWGPVILGHAHPLVLEAVLEAAKGGLSFGAPTQREVEMAELLTKLMPSMEQVRLVNSGTESTQTVIRLARGATHRNKILKFEGCYHGHVDSLLVKAGSGQLTLGLPDSPGIPPEVTQHTLTAAFNDLEAVHNIFKQHGHELAAVIVEPIAANMNLVLPQPEFLPALRKYCTEYGSLLIFDEVITGFRVGLHGAQALYNVIPDLTCLGKVIGGGLPVGAFGGRRDVMAHLAPLGAVYQAGTLSGNPLAVAAGLANLKALMQNQGSCYKTLSASSEKLTQGLALLAAKYHIPLQTHAIGGLFGLFFTERNDISNYAAVARCNISQFKQFFHGMLERGIYLAPSAFEAGFVSLAHTDVIIEKTLQAADEVFLMMSNEAPGFQKTKQARPLSNLSPVN